MSRRFCRLVITSSSGAYMSSERLVSFCPRLNLAFETTAASAFRLLAVPSSLRSSAAG